MKSRARTAPHAGAGFTLMEVLVALVIVALGMGAALAALGSSADNLSRLRERGFAQWIAFNRISETRLALTLPLQGSTSGEIEDYANARWRWTQDVTALDTPGILRITVRVRRADSGSDDSKGGWLATVTGFRGDALSAASGEQPNWNGVPPATGPQRPGTTQPGTGTTTDPIAPVPGGGAAPPGTSGPPAGG